MKEYSIRELYDLLNQGTLSSKSLVSMYLERIDTYDAKLNSLGDLNIDALQIAENLDEERQKKGPRSLLHGIPIVVKDNIFTHDSMRTTANSYVFNNFYAPYDATIVKKLKDAGAIILAKANCSEFAYFMSMGRMPSGFGSMYGQVKHPYNSKIDPLGSSTGSAVAVAANLIPASIGTETNGSLMSPAQQNSIVSIKPTVGLVSRHGIIPISRLQDTAGPMSRTVEDSAILLSVITGKDSHDEATIQASEKASDYLKAIQHPPKVNKIGMLRFENYPNDKEENQILEEAKKIFKMLDIEVIEINYTYDLPSNRETLQHEFKVEMNHFLHSLGVHAPVHSLKEIIDFNLTHYRRCLKYGQTDLIQSEMTDGRLKSNDYRKQKKALMKSIDHYLSLFVDHELDALITTKITGYPAIAGLPSLIIPAKPLITENPKSLLLIAPKWQEAVMLGLGHHYEQNTKHRVPPSLKNI